MDQQHSNGIYTYTGIVDKNGAFYGKGTLTYPSGKQVQNIKYLPIKEYTHIGKVINCTLLTQSQFDKYLGELLAALDPYDEEKIAIKHHQLTLNADTAKTCIKWLNKNKIKVVQWVSCWDDNTDESIKYLTDAGFTVVAAQNGESAVIVQDINLKDDWFMVIRPDNTLVAPQTIRMDLNTFLQQHHAPKIFTQAAKIDQYKAIAKLIYNQKSYNRNKLSRWWHKRSITLANSLMEKFDKNDSFFDQNGFAIDDVNDVYVGELKNYNKHGIGVKINEDGAMYEGQWENNEEHGKGTDTYKRWREVCG